MQIFDFIICVVFSHCGGTRNFFVGGIEGAKCDSEGAKIQKFAEKAYFGHFFSSDWGVSGGTEHLTGGANAPCPPSWCATGSFHNMFKIFKDPDENRPFLGLSWTILDIYICLFVILAFLPKRYPSLYFSLCNLVIFSREYCHIFKVRKIYVTRQW